MTLGSLPESCFPPAEATNKLASLRAKALKAKVAAPFPVMDLADFLPSWAEDSHPEAEAGEEGKKKGKLDMVRWIAAFHSFALAADAAEVCTFVQCCVVRLIRGCMLHQVWTYASAMAHFHVCLEIAAGAAAEKKRYSLAILYDEICRKEWHLKASRGTLLQCRWLL